jgi:ATP-dependent RNA helicase RhlE
MNFDSLGLSPELLKIVRQLNYEVPYPIQASAIPAILGGKDVLGIAKTGSGKTAGYVLPALMYLQNKTFQNDRNTNILVLVPTRELAEQVKEVFKIFSTDLPKKVKVMAVYGGVSINPQMKALQGINILVATPGRLLELVEANAVNLSKTEILILDEADKMLNLGFKEQMSRIFRLLPFRRQNLLFSATLSKDLDAINQVLLKDPVVIKIEEEEFDVELITQKAFLVKEEKKGPLLRYLIKENDMQQVLVFTSSVYQADNVAQKLKKNGIDAMAIHSKKSQGARTEALRRFKARQIRVLVATDLISRGIDIKFLQWVINYELPRSPKDYIHRIGRTGRAESPGTAIALVTPADEHHFKVIQKKMGKKIELIESENLI